MKYVFVEIHYNIDSYMSQPPNLIPCMHYGSNEKERRLPELLAKEEVAEVAGGIEIREQDQESSKPEWHRTVGGVQESHGYQQQVKEDGRLNDVDMHLLERFGKKMDDECGQSNKTHEKLESTYGSGVCVVREYVCVMEREGVGDESIC